MFLKYLIFNERNCFLITVQFSSSPPPPLITCDKKKSIHGNQFWCQSMTNYFRSRFSPKYFDFETNIQVFLAEIVYFSALKRWKSFFGCDHWRHSTSTILIIDHHYQFIITYVWPSNLQRNHLLRLDTYRVAIKVEY